MKTLGSAEPLSRRQTSTEQILLVVSAHCIWLVVEPYPSEKYDFVNWDDDIPSMNGKIKSHVPVTTNQLWLHSLATCSQLQLLK